MKETPPPPQSQVLLPDFDSKIKLADHELHVVCMGNGSPTVILEAGAGDNLATWKKVQPKIAEFTRVCSYSRAGLGKSTGQLQSAENVANDLHALLNSSEIKTHSPAPYILVGHSFGGIYNRYYLDKFPKDVAGMVLIDATPEELPQDLGIPEKTVFAALVAKIKIETYIENNKSLFEGKSIQEIDDILRSSKNDHAMIQEIKSISNPTIDAFMATAGSYKKLAILHAEDLKKMAEVMQKNPHPFGAKPLMILVAGKNVFDDMIHFFLPRREIIFAVLDQEYKASFDDFFKFDHKMLFEQIVSMMKNKCSLSTHCKAIIAENSGHNIQGDQPDLVVSAVKQIMQMLAEDSR